MTNAFKQALADGKVQIGLWNSLCSPIASELLADVGYDWMLFDSEHSPIDVAGLMPLLQASATGRSAQVVRPAWNDTVLIKRILDIGAQTLLVPFIQSAEEAAAAVAATRYPPTGIRGVAGSTRASRYGRRSDYLKTANDEICVLAQIETPTAMKELEAIAGIDGIDGVFIGPSDLSASMGHIGNPAHPEVQEALKDAALRLRRAGKPAGILAPAEADAKRYLDWGYTFVAVGVDTVMLSRAAETLLSRFR